METVTNGGSSGEPSARQLVLDYAYLPWFLTSTAAFFGLMVVASPLLSAKFVPAYSQLKPFVKADWNSRTVSCLHALIVSVISLYVVLADETTKSDNLWGASHIARVNVCLICAFLTADLIYMLLLFPLRESWVYIIHHVFVVGPFSFNMAYGILTFFANFRITAECSTLFVNIRWWLDVLDRKSGKLYVVNGLVMTAAFFLCRLAIIPAYYAAVWQSFDRAHSAMPAAYVALWLCGGLVMDALNTNWFRKMLRGATKVLRRQMETKQVDGGGAPLRTRVKGE